MALENTAGEDDDEFDRLWDTPELQRIDKRFRRDPFVAVPELLRAGRSVEEVAKAFKSCGLVSDFGAGYIVPNPDVIHAAVKSGAAWELSAVCESRTDVARQVADAIAEELSEALTLGVDDYVEVETYLFGYDERGEPVRVKTQTHVIVLQDMGELGRI